MQQTGLDSGAVRASPRRRKRRFEPTKETKRADLLPRVTLPKGGGAIRGIGEKFSVSAATGTTSLSVPLPLSLGRSSFTPQLQLAYGSGSGNGPFGFGSSLGFPHPEDRQGVAAVPG
jgi:hypothetical protein